MSLQGLQFPVTCCSVTLAACTGTILVVGRFARVQDEALQSDKVRRRYTEVVVVYSSVYVCCLPCHLTSLVVFTLLYPPALLSRIGPCKLAPNPHFCFIGCCMHVVEVKVLG